MKRCPVKHVRKEKQMSNSSIRYPTASISDLESTEVVTLSNSLIIDQPDSTRKTTLASILSSLGIMRCISFSKGGVLESQKDIAFYEEDGTFYTWNGPYPKIVEAGSTPKESGGVGSSAWISNKDTPLVRVWKYRAVADGETVIQLPTDIPVVGVQAIYVQGVRQDIGEGFSYDEGAATITLADELEAGNLVTVIIGVDPDSNKDIFAALKGTDGAYNIGTQSGDTVQAVLDNLLLKNQQLINKYGAELIGINPSGKLADVLNDVTPEQFGAIGDGVADDTQALKAMFKYINDMPISFTDTATELNPHLDVVAKRVVLRGLYMHTETIFIPSGVQIFQPGYSYFRRNVQQGFYFNPPSGEENMAAVSTYVYLKSGNTWYLNSDPMLLPQGAQIDNGTIRTGARHIDIENLSIITKPGTLLGLRWLGAAGCTTRNLSIGENTPNSTASTARIPKVGMLHSIAWGSVHTTPKILYKTQGAVFYEQNGGSEVKNAYIARLGQDSTYSEQVIYKPEDFDETGDVAITQYGRSSVQFRYCVTETCSFMYVNQGDASSNGGLKVDGCHMEATGGKAKHCFYIINSDADIRLNGLFIQDQSIANSSVVYVKNCVKGRSVIDIHGYMMVNGYRFLDGINSGAVVNIRNPNNGQFQYGKLGKWDLVNEITGVSPSTLYIDPVNGNDENWGLNGARCLKSLKHAAKICRMLEINDVYTSAGSINLTEDTELPSATIRGLGGIVCNANGSLIALRKTNVNLTLNGGVTSPTGYHLIKVATTEPVNVVSTGDMTTTTSANIFLFQANGNVEWTHNSGALACYRYAGIKSATYSGVIGLNIRATTRPAIDSTPVSGNVITKYSSILDS